MSRRRTSTIFIYGAAACTICLVVLGTPYVADVVAKSGVSAETVMKLAKMAVPGWKVQLAVSSFVVSQMCIFLAAIANFLGD